MLTVDSKRKIAAMGIFLLPVGVIVGTGMFFGGPSSVSANAVPVSAVPKSPVLVRDAGPEQDAQAAIEHIAWLDGQKFGESPLYHPPKGQENVQTDVRTDDDSIPQFSIKMIMKTRGGNIALINGKQFRVGDTLPNSAWKISAIDPIARSVTIEDTLTDRTYTQSQ